MAFWRLRPVGLEIFPAPAVSIASAATTGLGLLVIDRTTGSAGMYLSVVLLQTIAVVGMEMATGAK